MAIGDWSTTAASNLNAVTGVNFDEGQSPSSVNDSARELMAQVATWYQDAEWRDMGDTPTRTGNTTFTVPGDRKSVYVANRPIRCTDSSTLYGYITGSTYTAVTTCTVSLDSGNLSASLSAVALGVDPSTKSIHPNSLRTVGVANGGTGATTAADARTNLGLGALAVLASVDQSTIDAASVGQGELKTTTGTATFNYAATDVAHDSHYAMPGGTYGFLPQTNVSGSGSYASLNVAFRAGVGAYAGGAFSTAYMRITSSGTASDSSGSITATQRYVQASPPYDLGDGPIEQFTFLVVDSLGNARHVWSATEAPWHYNGPTQIAAQRIDRATGRKYRRMHPLVAEFGSMRAAMKALPVAALNSRLAEAQVEVEITQAMKQADMPLIPHPFGFALKPDETLIILDPVSPVMQRLAELQSEGIPVGELIAQGYLQFGNTALPRKAPPGVMPVSVAWR